MTKEKRKVLKAQRKSIRKKMVLLAITGLMLVGLFGCGKKDADNNTGSKETTQGPRIDNTTPTEPLESDLDKEYYKIGDRITYKDISVTLKSVKTHDGKTVGDPQISLASEGETFIVCNFLIENHNKDYEYIPSYAHFTGTSDGIKARNFDFSYDIGETGFSEGADPQGTVEGSAIFYGVKEDFKTFEITYEPFMGGIDNDDTKIHFKFSKDQVK